MEGLGFGLRALRSRNYRLFFGGQSVSLIGSWMTRIATSWLVYRLTGSAAMLGVSSFCGQAPMFFLAPVAGAWVDRWDRRRTLVLTQVLSMLQSLALAALALTGAIRIWHVVVLALAQGVINAFDMPARQSFVVQMVEHREDLSNAIALNSSMVNAARLIGPSLAGIVIAAVGEGWCFLIDGVSYIGVIFSLIAMRLPRDSVLKAGNSVRQEIREGWGYVTASQPIRSLLLLLMVVSLVGMPYSVLMPVMAARVLNGGPKTLGILMAASGIGALTGAVMLAMRRSILGLGRHIVLSAAMFGVALILFSQSRTLWLSMVVLPLAGFGMMQESAATNTILQTIVEDDKRGRVMAYYAMAFQGMMPFGSLWAGLMSDRVGAPATLALGGTLCIGGAIWFAFQLRELRRLVRPVYVRLGILPLESEGG